MKIDLSTLFEMIEQEDKNLSKTSAPVKQEKQKETALDLQGLFSLFEQLEPQLGEAENLEGYEDVEMVLKFAKIPITSKLGNRETQDHKYFGEMVSSLTGGTRDPVEVFTKIKKVQEQLLSTPKLEIREIVSGMVIIEAFYSFFNAFYSIGSDKREQGIKLGLFAESFAAGLYGANTTIPYGFGNSTLFTVADFLYSENGKDIPISLKTRQQLGTLGSRFRVLHDLVKYGKVYFDIFEKAESGASGIYDVTFKRKILTLQEDGEKIAGQNQQLLKELKELYGIQSGTRQPLKEMAFEPESVKTGINAVNNLENKIFVLSLYYSDQIGQLKNIWNGLNNLYQRKLKGPQAKLVSINEEGEESLSMSPDQIKRLTANLLGRELPDTNINTAYKKLLSPLMSKENTLKPPEVLEKEILEDLIGNPRKIEYIADQRKPILAYVLGQMKVKMPVELERKAQSILGNIEQEAPDVGVPKEIANAIEAAKINKKEPPKKQDKRDEQDEEEKMKIFLQQYPNQKNNIQVLNVVKQLNSTYTNLESMKPSELRDFGVEISITLDPNKLRQIFQNGNDSLEENYRQLVQRMNLVSELMKKYFLNPTASTQDGENLKNAANELPETTEKAVKNKPTKK